MIKIFCITLLICLFSHITASHDAERVTILPGQTLISPRSELYSGYIDISTQEGVIKKIHYLFALSEHDPANDPVVFWTNGGPGCSAHEGAFYEQGPLVYHDFERQLVRNPQSWTRGANMLFVEQPLGVGFSYSNIAIETTDDTAGVDAKDFIVGWLKSWTEYSDNEFYISGESYAGIYVPHITMEVLSHNAKAKQGDQKVNIKGILIGNGCSGNETWSCGLPPAASFEESPLGEEIQLAYNHKLISLPTYNAIVGKCKVSDTRDIWDIYGRGCYNATYDPIPSTHKNYECCQAYETMNANMGPIDIYGIYDECHAVAIDSSVNPPKKQMIEQQRRHRARGLKTIKTSKKYQASPLHGFTSCVDSDVQLTHWLNWDKVRNALHVPGENITGSRWATCADINYTKTTINLVDDYTKFVKEGLRVLIFSGDTDACVPTTGTVRWVTELASKNGWGATEDWRPFYSANHVAGYISSYDVSGTGSGAFTLATIRGAGHMVPEDKPVEAFTMFANFLSNCAGNWSSCPGTTSAQVSGIYVANDKKGTNPVLYESPSYNPMTAYLEGPSPVNVTISRSYGQGYLNLRARGLKSDGTEVQDGGKWGKYVGFQWYKDNVLLHNESYPTLLLKDLDHSHSGKYKVAPIFPI